MSTRDFFRRYSTPPSPAHEHVQKIAIEERWTPPWYGEEQKREAGKRSALARVKAAKVRLEMIAAAYSLLEPEFKTNPYSKRSIEALAAKYYRLWGEREPARPPAPPTEDQIDFLIDMLIELTGTVPKVIFRDRIEDLYYECLNTFRGPPPEPLSEEESLVWLSVKTETVPLTDLSPPED
jgi:hypothetical protein